MATLLTIHPVDPQPRLVAQVAQALRDGGLVALPTDACYALAALLGNQQAKERIRQIRHLDARHHYTLMCHDFAQLGQLVRLGNAAFRSVKAATPGPYTFILPATREVPRRLQHERKRTVGVRIPDHRVAQAILAEVGEPLLTSSLLLPGDPRAPWPPARTSRTPWAPSSTSSWTATPAAASRPPWSTSRPGVPEVVRAGAGDPSRFRWAGVD
jgi:translation factor SUA5